MVADGIGMDKAFDTINQNLVNKILLATTRFSLLYNLRMRMIT